MDGYMLYVCVCVGLVACKLNWIFKAEIYGWFFKKKILIYSPASSNAEVLTRKHEEKYSPNATRIKGRTPVAIIKKNSGQRGTLACTIPWGEFATRACNKMRKAHSTLVFHSQAMGGAGSLSRTASGMEHWRGRSVMTPFSCTLSQWPTPATWWRAWKSTAETQWECTQHTPRRASHTRTLTQLPLSRTSQRRTTTMRSIAVTLFFKQPYFRGFLWCACARKLILLWVCTCVFVGGNFQPSITWKPNNKTLLDEN